MGGFFGAVSKNDCILDVFFGTDYHSHLGTRRGGMTAFDSERGFQRDIHNIENAPFRTKFERVTTEMQGTSAIGSISDADPQPMLIRSNLGTYAISTIGVINNAEALTDSFLAFSGGHFAAMSGGRINATELVAALINQKSDFAEGIRFAQKQIDGAASILILDGDGSLLAARDRMGRMPVLIGKRDDGFCVSFESFAYHKLGYTDFRELGPGEIVRLTVDGCELVSPPRKEMKICAFLWSYYGYPTSVYEDVNVECMRTRNGALMAANERRSGTMPELDFVCGVPDSGTPHAIGYANESRVAFARPFIKYTPTWPRSFMPQTQNERNRVAKMKLLPVHELIEGKRLLFVDDSIVRGTQLRETVEFLYENGAKEVHIRSACPPILYGCKFLNFSRNNSDMDLIARRVILELEGEEGFRHFEEYADSGTERGKALRDAICAQLHFASLEYQSLDSLLEAIGLPADCICTYCWNGK